MLIFRRSLPPSALILSMLIAGTFLWLSIAYFRNPHPAQSVVASVSDHDAARAIGTPDGLTLLGVRQDRFVLLPPEVPLPKVVALTFDDGPHPQHTSELLDILKAHHVHATFFVLGERADALPATIRRIAQEGHQIGNHSWDHTGNIRTVEAMRKQMQLTNDVIFRNAGVLPTTMRPPYGWLTEIMQKAIDLPIILWSVDTRDWESRDPDVIAERAISFAHPGAVILLHDIYGETVLSLDKIITTLEEQGYSFLTVDELFRFTDPSAHAGELFYFADVREWLREDALTQ